MIAYCLMRAVRPASRSDRLASNSASVVATGRSDSECALMMLESSASPAAKVRFDCESMASGGVMVVRRLEQSSY